jgi:hypothetical protein
MAHSADLRLRDAAQLRELRVGEAVLLREAEGRGIQLGRRLHERGDLVDEGHLVEEPRVDLRRLEGLLDRRALAHRLLQRHDAAVGRRLRDLEQLLHRAGSSPQWKLDPRFSSERSAFCSAVV